MTSTTQVQSSSSIQSALTEPVTPGSDSNPMLEAYLNTPPPVVGDVFGLLTLIVQTSVGGRAQARKLRQTAKEAEKEAGIAAANAGYEAAKHTFRGAMTDSTLQIAGGVAQGAAGVYAYKSGSALSTPAKSQGHVDDKGDPVLVQQQTKKSEHFTGRKLELQATGQILNAFGNFGKAFEDLDAAGKTKEKDLLAVVQRLQQTVYDDQSDTMKNQQELTQSMLQAGRDIAANIHETNRTIVTA